MFRRWWQRFAAWANRHTVEAVVAVMIVLFLIVVFAQQMFVNIPAGSVGVVWHRLGGTDVCHKPLSEGLKLKFPWDEIYAYNTRLTQADQDIDVLSIDGLKLRLNIAYRYELNPYYAAFVHKLVGPHYDTVLVGSDIAAHSRDILSGHTPEQIYSSQRAVIEGDIRSAVEAHLQTGFNPDYLIGENGGQVASSGTAARSPVCTNPASGNGAPPQAPAFAAAVAVPTPSASPPPVRWIQVEDVLIRSIELPPSVQAAINSKNQEQQLNQEYDYRVLREQKETTRKTIEAQGIRAIAGAVTPGYLRWRGIDATLQLAQSQNAKVVIIGSGQGGLPIILGNMDNGQPVNGTVSSTGAGASSAASRPVADSTDATLQPPIDALLQRGVPVSSPAPPAAASGGGSAAAGPRTDLMPVTPKSPPNGK